MTREVLGSGGMVLFALGLLCWILLFRAIYSPRAGVWWIEAVTLVVVGSILGAVVATMLGYRGIVVTGAAWVAGGLAVALSRPRS